MFGFGKSKTEKMVLKLERVMMAIESAYEKGKLDAARFGVNEQMRILNWLQSEGEWSEDQVRQYLEKRGLVRAVSDESYRDEIVERLMVL